MDRSCIYNLLKSRTHNDLYLNRYMKFLSYCLECNEVDPPDYIERHHILPKAKDMFPEYSSFSKNPWNRADLSFRQHLLCHYFLMKACNIPSQTLSFLMTSGQFHAKELRQCNTKLLESARKKLSQQRKGSFVGGYNEDGTPKVSKETRDKISKIKKEFYSDPENRNRQSLYCKGKKRSNTKNIKKYAQNRTQDHQKNLTESIRKAWEEKRESGSTRRIKEGVYVTPIGNFTSIREYASYCRNPDKPFTTHNAKKNPKLNSSVIGMTPKELGFDFVRKGDTTISQYYDGLNQARPPEPNHLLWSELNDYLLREKFHPQT